MPSHAAGRRRKKLTRKQKAVRWAGVILGLLVLLVIIGNLLPAPAHASAPSPRPQESVSAASAPVQYWTDTAHIRAVIDGRTLMLDNMSQSPASAVFSLAQLKVSGQSARILNVRTGKTVVTGALAVTLPPGGTAVYIVK